MNTYGLNIHLQSFYLNRNLIESNDKVRVSITTIPEENKEAFITDADKTGNIHHFFTVNVTDQTKKIIFVFRKKSFFSNHIIASTIVPKSELPQSQNDNNNTEVKTIKIYEPFQHLSDNPYAMQNRRIYGEMKIQVTPTEAFPVGSIKDPYNNYKKKITNKHPIVNVSSVNNKSYMSYGYYSNENQNDYQKYSQGNDQNQFAEPDVDNYQNDYQYQNQQQNQYNNQYPQEQYQQQPQLSTVAQNQPQPAPVQQQNQMVFVNDLI